METVVAIAIIAHAEKRKRIDFQKTHGESKRFLPRFAMKIPNITSSCDACASSVPATRNPLPKTKPDREFHPPTAR